MYKTRYLLRLNTHMGKCTHRERSIVLVRYRGRPRTQELLVPAYPQRLIK
ncbi:hypothetical protein HanIR_Chr02g0059401 [Helianthus annuus]|nr:hypothetical protein HanIR_Chr02g0059401 [Helianthus annuus]